MISINELKHNLSLQYSLKCFTDLAQVTASPWEIYTQFKSIRQPKFESNDRLVFFTSNNIEPDLLQHLYQAANLIDISNFFILICNPHNIEDQVKVAANLYSPDQVAFQTLQIELEQTSPLHNNFFVPETLCPMPWMNLEVLFNGEIRPCCIYEDKIGNIKDMSLNEAFHGELMSNLRQELLNGKKASGCNHCWKVEKQNLISNRSQHMNFLKTELLTSKLETPTITSLDLKPGNTCNFKCRICNPMASSLFAQEANKYQKIAVKTFNWAEDNSKGTNEIISLLPTLTNIDLYGGEPFLIKPLTHLVKQAVESGHSKHIRLHYNSNGSIYPINLIEYWKTFKQVDIHFSIDNIGNRFELERGSSWHSVESNIKKLIDLQLPNVKISVMTVISIMNIFYLDELLDWASGLNISINPVYLLNPPGFDIKNLTADAKLLIIDKFKNHPWPEMKNIINAIKSSPGAENHEFVKLCKHFDSIRNQNFSKSHPEIAKAMGYVYNSL